jgi:purine-binding chemotaxis protein CheW
MQAVIVGCDGHPYGLLVDHVEDVVAARDTIEPVRAALSGGWARATIGVVNHEGEALPLIDPAVLIAGCPTAAAA